MGCYGFVKKERGVIEARSSKEALQESLKIYVKTISDPHGPMFAGKDREAFFEALDKYVDERVNIAIWRNNEKSGIRPLGSI